MRFAIDLPAEEAKKYFGTFELSPDFKLRILEEYGKFYAQRIGEDQKFRIFYYKENHFFLKKMEAQLEFRLADNLVILHQGAGR